MVIRQLEIDCVGKKPYGSTEHEKIWVILDTSKAKKQLRSDVLSAIFDYEMWKGFEFEGCDSEPDTDDELKEMLTDALELDEPGKIGYISNPSIKIYFSDPKSNILKWKIDGYNYGIVCCPKCGKNL